MPDCGRMHPVRTHTTYLCVILHIFARGFVIYVCKEPAGDSVFMLEHRRLCYILICRGGGAARFFACIIADLGTTMHLLASKQETVYQELCARIVDGEYIAGMTIPTEFQLVDSFGVSRTSVRIALCKMQEEGLIYRRRSAGTFVTPAAKQILEGRAQAITLRVLFLLVPGQACNPIYLGILKACSDLRLPGVSFELRLEEQLHFEQYQESGADFLIIDGGLMDQIRILPRGWHGKVIVLNRVSDKYNHICTDNVLGGSLLVQHLLSKGHRKIALIHYGLNTEQDFSGRLQGVYDALKQAEVMPALDLAIQLHQYRAFSPHNAAEAVLCAAQEKKVTAAIVITDLLAVPFYELASLMRVRIPQDVSIIGFDDQPYARFLCPPLTTVRQPLAEIAGKLGELVAQFAAGNRPFCACRIPPVLIERASAVAL